jgi:hypothetical protein
VVGASTYTHTLTHTLHTHITNTHTLLHTLIHTHTHTHTASPPLFAPLFPIPPIPPMPLSGQMQTQTQVGFWERRLGQVLSWESGESGNRNPLSPLVTLLRWIFRRPRRGEQGQPQTQTQKQKQKQEQAQEQKQKQATQKQTQTQKQKQTQTQKQTQHKQRLAGDHLEMDLALLLNPGPGNNGNKNRDLGNKSGELGNNGNKIGNKKPLKNIVRTLGRLTLGRTPWNNNEIQGNPGTLSEVQLLRCVSAFESALAKGADGGSALAEEGADFRQKAGETRFVLSPHLAYRYLY